MDKQPAAVRHAIAYAERWAEYRQKSTRTPGVALAIRLDGDLLVDAAFGLADVERQVPLTTAHRFRIASHSKTFTATAVMQLVDQEQLRLDDRIGSILTWLPSGKDEVGRRTVRQLLNHVGGIDREGPDGNFWQYGDPFPDAAAVQALMTEAKPPYAGSEQFKYSNLAYAVLGLVVEKASGQPYNEYVRQHILQRLDLRETGPELPKNVDRFATGYSSDRYGLERFPLDHVDTAAFSPATGVYSTAADLCRYAAGHFLGDEQLLSDEAKREMQHGYWKVPGSDEHYGLGFEIYDFDGHHVVAHSGGFPGFATSTHFDPKERVVVVALTNAINGPAVEITAAILKLIYKATTMRTQGAWNDQLLSYVGRYFNLWTTNDIVRLGDRLYAVCPDSEDPVADMIELSPNDDGTLTITKDGGFGSAGERVRLLKDARGKVTGINWGSYDQYVWDEFTRRWPQAVGR